ncbi:MAG: hypothetical protein PHY87_01295 [Sphaerochaeta sp.]|jgi:hypothetical protein|uniref:hypothetical protein n=1 Tax=Sphaerochaeta sp. TaxID=1972642 RepID=UPI001D32CCEB|nr:hypothetical protein [uncultured Sphaerochaeta sp.]MDD3057354.1 hypothetical protein [Sphaerochaeta sp.]MDD3928414.1 hypothetical protein [Sphaerochaeta sp.]NCC12315.1 hypothetical protein [Spirochaetia bacterium]NCC88752.1 hypothetical protein [Spirochaetia bacterium]
MDEEHISDLTGEQNAFHTAYDTTLHYLRTRQQVSKQNLIDVEGELFHLTVYEGQDWGGRGILKNAEIQGQIYAYIAFINEMKKEQGL